jgi:hypothetical protein
MKRLFLVAGLCIAAALVAPIASASAAEGSCEIKGAAEFSPEITLTPQAKVKYKFQSSGGKCTTVPETEFKEAKVEGQGDIGCLASTEEAPTATGKLVYIEDPKGAKTLRERSFKFFFAAAGALVVFHTEGEVEAAGFATFGQEGLEKCETGKVKSLPFTAVATGKT